MRNNGYDCDVYGGVAEYDGPVNIMERYDRLPKELREYVANYPYNIQINVDDLEYYIETMGIKSILKKFHDETKTDIEENALLAYGKDHPQAKKEIDYEKYFKMIAERYGI